MGREEDVFKIGKKLEKMISRKDSSVLILIHSYIIYIYFYFTTYLSIKTIHFFSFNCYSFLYYLYLYCF